MSKYPTQYDDVIDPQLLNHLFEAIQPEPLPPGLRAKVLARAFGSSVPGDWEVRRNDFSERELGIPVAPMNTTPFEIYVDRIMSMFDLGEEQARTILKKAASKDEDTFETCPIPGAQLFYFKGGARTANATCGILKIKTGVIFPAHEHQGNEHVLILQGTAIDRSGRRYRVGDVVYHQKDTRHSFRVVGKDPMLLAVLLEKPNKWLKGQIILDYVLKKRRFVSNEKK